MQLVMQRQFEQFAGPVVHLVGLNHVPLTEPAASRVFVSMWLADSSGLHIGRRCDHRLTKITALGIRAASTPHGSFPRRATPTAAGPLPSCGERRLVFLSGPFLSVL